MSAPLSLSVFFPAYNEEQNITDSVKQAEAVLQTITPTYEIIVVNDGSRDSTGAIADTLAKNNPHIRVVHHNPNQGYGAAVWSGMQAARYDYVFFTDADLQFDLKEIKKLLAYVPEYQVVIGYRAKRRDPFMRILNAKGWNILNRFLFGLQVKDIDCAFKLFDRRVVANLPLQSRGAMMSAELLIRLQRQGIRFKEVPVTHLPRTAGSPTGAKPSVILRAFRELFQTYRGELGSVTQHQIVKFVSVGILNTVVDLGLYFLLTRSLGWFTIHLVTAKIISFCIGAVVGYVLNRHWTFRTTTAVTWSEFTRYALTIGIALLINSGSLYLFVHRFHLYDLIGALLATLISFTWNFTISKWWVFNQRRGHVAHSH